MMVAFTSPELCHAASEFTLTVLWTPLEQRELTPTSELNEAPHRYG